MTAEKELTTVQKLKSAGRDLMPIIAVCASAIVLTLVAVTVYKLTLARDAQVEEVQPSLLDKRYIEILARGEHFFLEGNFEAAQKEYTAAIELAEKNEGSPILLAELQLRLARVMLAQNRPERAEQHLQKASEYLLHSQQEINAMHRDLKQEIQRQKALSKTEGRP